MPLETVDTASILQESCPAREKTRSTWPCMIASAAVLWVAAWALGPSVTLIGAGIAGALAAVSLIPSMRRMAYRINHGSWKTVLVVWITSTLALCASLVLSGMGHITRGKADLGRAATELNTTIAALALTGLWLALIRLPRKSSPCYQIATTLSVIEAARLAAFGQRPGIWSLLVWVAAVFCAWSSFAHRASRDY